ncbi:T9SS type B sorting domain-containing protein [Pedobacter sp. PWIIR3]
MRFSLFLYLLYPIFLELFGAVPINDDVRNATSLSSSNGYCSLDAEFSNIDATASGFQKASLWPSDGKDVWFKFTALKTDVSATVSGKTSAMSINTLQTPLVAFYTFNGTVLTENIGSMSTSNNTTTAYKGGLIIGMEYYIRISASNNATGTFKLCLNNYTPAIKPGQDCSTASFVCSKETFTELSLSGAGNNNQESAGTCLNGESNSAWYKWIAADDGTLTFTITPTSDTDDIDWVLYDLGPTGDCINVNASNAIRCAAGNGISCSPSYFKTGLDLNSTDLSEQKGCPIGQDGFLKYVDMIKGHTYALLIDNFSSANNGFTLAFGGNGSFSGPPIEIQTTKNNECTTQQSFSFAVQQGDFNSFKWNFGEGANSATANSTGPYQITYASYGQKTVTLEAKTTAGCTTTSYYNFQVTEKPALPIITASNLNLCVDDLLKLTTFFNPNITYKWTGPNNFSSTEQNPEIKITGPENSGDYKLTTKFGDCESDAATINIPTISKKPIAEFYTNPPLNTKYAIPTTISFINQSINADTYSWDFGDQGFSNLKNPTHIYTAAGSYNISLTAVSANNCAVTVAKGRLVLLDNADIFIPSVFTPNGDGVNDEFQVSMVNLRAYHIVILNRWGIKVFENTNILSNWNGQHQNKDLPVGVYFFQIRVKTINDKEINQSGTITLLR